jgi:hypothetical protein
MARLRIRARVDISQGTPPVDISGVVKVIDSAGKEVWSGRISDRAGSTPFSKEYVLETVDLVGGDYDLQAGVDISNAVGSKSLSRRERFWLGSIPGPGLAVFDIYPGVQQDIVFSITFRTESDPYGRYAGAWLDIDHGPDFWMKGQANLGIIAGSAQKGLSFVNVPPGRHRLYVRVSAPQGFVWEICASANGASLGCRYPGGVEPGAPQIQIRESSSATTPAPMPISIFTPPPPTVQFQPCQPGTPPAQCPSGWKQVLGSDCRYYCEDPNAPGRWILADAFANARYIFYGGGVDPLLGGCLIVCYMDGSTYGTNCPDNVYLSETRKCFEAARA